MGLNQQAAELCSRLISRADPLRIAAQRSPSGAQIIDCGIQVRGGLEAGRALAEICMSGLGRVDLVPANAELNCGPSIQTTTDHPTRACMASQYAGWQIAEGKFFAIGSGPMRAAAGKEQLFDKIGCREQSDSAVGVLETRQFPPDEVCQKLAHDCGVEPDRLTLLLAPTASQAGTVQIVARTVETALHKLLELGFDLDRIESGYGTAPLPPVAADDLTAIGRTNDAILYGGEVTLWVRGEDSDLEQIGPRVPSGGSPDHGQPFATIFQRYDRDFYRIDPHLFSPAVVTLVNLDSGRSFRFGHTLPRVVHQSFDVRQLGR